MDGPIYHTASPFNYHLRRTSGLICTTTFVPSGAKGVAEKLNSPIMYVYAESFGLECAVRRRLSVILAYSISLSHSGREKVWIDTSDKMTFICLNSSLCQITTMCVRRN